MQPEPLPIPRMRYWLSLGPELCRFGPLARPRDRRSPRGNGRHHKPGAHPADAAGKKLSPSHAGQMLKSFPARVQTPVISDGMPRARPGQKWRHKDFAPQVKVVDRSTGTGAWAGHRNEKGRDCSRPFAHHRLQTIRRCAQPSLCPPARRHPSTRSARPFADTCPWRLMAWP